MVLIRDALAAADSAERAASSVVTASPSFESLPRSVRRRNCHSCFRVSDFCSQPSCSQSRWWSSALVPQPCCALPASGIRDHSDQARGADRLCAAARRSSADIGHAARRGTAAPTPETVAPPAVSVTSAAEQVPIAAPAEPEKIALPETAAPLSTPATAAVEITAPVAATPKPEVVAKSEATKIEEREPLTTVAVAPATSVEPVRCPPPEPAAVPAPAAAAEVVAGSQPTATLTDDDAKLSSTKIAMLGGPPVDTESVPLPKAKPAAEPAREDREEAHRRQKAACGRQAYGGRCTTAN